jgi:hypothetical protein
MDGRLSQWCMLCGGMCMSIQRKCACHVSRPPATRTCARIKQGSVESAAADFPCGCGGVLCNNVHMRCMLNVGCCGYWHRHCAAATGAGKKSLVGLAYTLTHGIDVKRLQQLRFVLVIQARGLMQLHQTESAQATTTFHASPSLTIPNSNSNHALVYLNVCCSCSN